MDGLRNIAKFFLSFGSEGLLTTVSAIVTNGAQLTTTSVYTNIMALATDIGLALLVVFFLVEFAEETTHDNFTIEHFIRLSIKFVIGKEIMDNLSSFISGCLAITASLTQDIGSESAHAYSEVAEAIDNGGLLELIGLIVMLSIVFLISLGIRGFIFAICYTRTFEIAIRGMFMPIAISDIFSGGLNSSGFRYLKKFFACTLQGALIIAVVSMSNSLTSVSMSSDSYMIVAVLNQLVIGATTAAVIMKTQQWASDIIG